MEWIDIKEKQPKVGSFICIKVSKSGSPMEVCHSNVKVLGLYDKDECLVLHTIISNHRVDVTNFCWRPYTEGMTITV